MAPQRAPSDAEAGRGTVIASGFLSTLVFVTRRSDRILILIKLTHISHKTTHRNTRDQYKLHLQHDRNGMASAPAPSEAEEVAALDRVLTRLAVSEEAQLEQVDLKMRFLLQERRGGERGGGKERACVISLLSRLS